MKSKTLVSFMVLVMVSAFAAGMLSPVFAQEVKYYPLDQFGIKVPVKNLYSKKNVGKTFGGKVIGETKFQLVDAAFQDARKGDQLEVTYLGNGFVRVTVSRIGRTAAIEIKETLPR